MKLNRLNFQNQRGSMMITLMIFVVVSLIITVSSVLLVIDNTVTSTNQELGIKTYYVAESGIENALLRLLRDPSYTGEVLAIGTGQATITVTGSDPMIIRSVGTLDAFQRTVEVQAQRINGVVTVTSWKEIK